jgi:integrase
MAKTLTVVAVEKAKAVAVKKAKRLTAKAVESSRPKAERCEIPDPGCTGLYLIVQPSGVKSWAARYRYRGRSIKLTLGPVLIGAAESASTPEVGAPLSLAHARELCARVLREAQAGSDPAQAKRQRREQQHAAEANTLQAICEEHLRREAGRNLRTLDSLRRPDLELFYPELGRLPIDQIKRGQFIRVLDQIEDDRGQRRAGRALGSMKTLLNWYANRSEHVSVLTRTTWRASGPAGGRDRVLSDDELRAIWLAAEQEPGPFGAFIRFALLTATRRNEAAGLRRSELSEGDKVWTIPGARYKSKRDVLVPLSVRAQEIVASMPVLPGGDYVFSVKGVRAINDFAKFKTRFDKASGVTGWRLHDLRRTARTLLSRAGISADHAERCLGHAIGGVRKTYDRFEYRDEKLHAFEALAGLIERIVRPVDTVVPMPRAKPGRRK